MRFESQPLHGLHKILFVISRIPPPRYAPPDPIELLAPLLNLVEQACRGLPFGMSRAFGQSAGHDQSVAVFHRQVSKIAKPKGIARTLAIQPRVRVGRAFEHIALEQLASAARARTGRIILGPVAVLARPRLDERATDTEVLRVDQ